jgi:hypothetical protein
VVQSRDESVGTGTQARWVCRPSGELGVTRSDDAASRDVARRQGDQPASSFAADPVPVPVKAVRVRLPDGESPAACQLRAGAVEIGGCWRDAEIGV